MLVFPEEQKGGGTAFTPFQSGCFPERTPKIVDLGEGSSIMEWGGRKRKCTPAKVEGRKKERSSVSPPTKSCCSCSRRKKTRSGSGLM